MQKQQNPNQHPNPNPGRQTPEPKPDPREQDTPRPDRHPDPSRLPGDEPDVTRDVVATHQQPAPRPGSQESGTGKDKAHLPGTEQVRRPGKQEQGQQPGNDRRERHPSGHDSQPRK